MSLPFTDAQFYGVFRDYNTTLWPVQILLLALGPAAFALVFTPRRWSGAAISAILAFLWAWLALAYHAAFFAKINPVAYAFSFVSLIGAALLFWYGVVRRSLSFRLVRGARSSVGLLLVVFALLLYPAWSYLAGNVYPIMPTFGLPCPTTIFTLGMLSFLVTPYPRGPLIIPVLWCLVGAQAAFLLGVHQDLGLVAAAIVGVVLIIRSKGPGQKERLA